MGPSAEDSVALHTLHIQLLLTFTVAVSTGIHTFTAASSAVDTSSASVASHRRRPLKRVCADCLVVVVAAGCAAAGTASS